MIFWCRYAWALLTSVCQHGVNLFSVLNAWAKWQPSATAFVIDEAQFSYHDILQYSQYLCHVWQQEPLPEKVGLLLGQDLDSIAALFALSRLGKHVVIVNARLTTPKMTALLRTQDLHLVGVPSLLADLPITAQRFSAIPTLAMTPEHIPLPILPRANLNTISVCSSGSTGTPKLSSRQSKPWLVWPLLDTLLRRLQFLRLKSLFVMTPICHGAGFSAALMAFTFGKKVVLQKRLDTGKALALIDQHQIDTLNAVPTILYRLWQQQTVSTTPMAMASVQRLVCGSAPLSAKLYQDFQAAFPHIAIYNVFGSSETGINLLATPEDLIKHPDSAGRPIAGVKIKMVGQNGETLGINETGVLWSRCAWSAKAMQWLQSGDLAYQDADGYVYLKGRVDDMAICGGVNVYPVDLENVLLSHPDIAQALAYPVEDSEYGQRLAVQVVLAKNATVLDNSHAIYLWLGERIPHSWAPTTVTIVDVLQTDSIGKVLVK